MRAMWSRIWQGHLRLGQTHYQISSRGNPLHYQPLNTRQRENPRFTMASGCLCKQRICYSFAMGTAQNKQENWLPERKGGRQHTQCARKNLKTVQDKFWHHQQCQEPSSCCKEVLLVGASHMTVKGCSWRCFGFFPPLWSISAVVIHQ